jgi:hypothetical protein
MCWKSVGRRAVVAWLLLMCVVAAAAVPPAAWAQEKGWRVYRNDVYGFSVGYPRAYVILRERKGSWEGSPQPLARVRFQERRRASGQFADLEPPQFSVEVFDNPRGESLREWLGSAGWVGERDGVEPAELEGAREGLRVRWAAQMAPNEFYFYRVGRHVFRLVPLGEHAPAMLDSFRLRPARAGG